MVLTLFNQNVITNNELNKEITVVKNCIASNLTNGWQMAMALASIKDNDLFEDDFESFNEFCELILNKSQAQVNRVINATHIASESHFDLSKNYTVTQICELAPLGIELIDELINNVLIDNTMTCKELREIVKARKTIEKSEEITEDKEIAETTENTETIEDLEEIDNIALWLSSCPYQLSDEQYKSIMDILN